MMLKRTKIKVDVLKGRGVYADEKIPQGALIEFCHLIILPEKEVGPQLERFVFYFSETHYAMALGNGALYNHSDRPCALVEMDDAKKVIEISALRDIKKGEEITIDYGYSSAERKKFGIK